MLNLSPRIIEVCAHVDNDGAVTPGYWAVSVDYLETQFETEAAAMEYLAHLKKEVVANN